jgi:enamine deaminase RidA (YjgF/YER057c/UK114 family)|tara:strand:+ start:186 stop:596 length:411 start_codon:yes stop_codon:yes gene_type:complete
MNEIKRINPESLRIPTKAYSQGVLVPIGNTELLFVTGQLPQDIDGNVVAPNDAKTQTELVFSRISKILQESGMTIDHVVKVQIFVKNIKDAKIISKIRDDVFKNSRPASTLVEVSNFVKEGCCVEIEVTAAKIKNT